MSREKLEQTKRNWEEKLAEYEYELSITASAPQKFELRKRIEECQQEIERITKKIESLEKESQSQNNQLYTQIPESASDSIDKSKTIYTSDTKDNFKLMEFRDRQEILASVVFFFIPQLAEQEPNISNNALILLNEILKERLLDRGLELRILSSISGAIAIIPDSSGIYIHQHLSVILEDCKNQGIPVRLGITHGELEILKDADTLFSFIGIPMNVAARLSTSDKNKGILYDSTYIAHVRPLPTSKNNDPLHPRYCNDVDIIGKPWLTDKTQKAQSNVLTVNSNRYLFCSSCFREAIAGSGSRFPFKKRV